MDLSQSEADIGIAVESELIHRRAVSGLLARFLAATMPPDPKPIFVFPLLAHMIVTQRNKSVWRFLPLAMLLLSLTFATITQLYTLPFMRYSVVSLLSKLFGMVLPGGWAVAAAWIVGIVAVLMLGTFINHSRVQHELDQLNPTKFGVYNFWLRMALYEEMAFRAGSEKWNWFNRMRASLVFGIIHVTNIWYSFAAGIGLAVTGFAFLLVYQWSYHRTRSQVEATATAAVVHAVYNIAAIVVIIGVVVASLMYIM